MEENRLQVGALSIGAYRAADRWLIFIEASTDAGPELIWESTHSQKADDDLDLENPVFQECHVQRAPSGGGQLLLVGQCRRRHFSGVLSVEAGRVRLEVADRWTIPLAVRQVRIAGALGNSVEQIDRSVEGSWDLRGAGGRVWRFTPQPMKTPLLAGFQIEAARRTLSLRSYPTKSPVPPTTAAYGFDLLDAR